MCSSCHGLPWLFFLCFWISFPFLPTLITEGDRCQELPQQRQSVHRMPLYTRLSLAHQYLCLPHYSTKMSHSLWGLFAVQTPVLSNDYYLPLFAMAIVFNFIRGAYHIPKWQSKTSNFWRLGWVGEFKRRPLPLYCNDMNTFSRRREQQLTL